LPVSGGCLRVRRAAHPQPERPPSALLLGRGLGGLLELADLGEGLLVDHVGDGAAGVLLSVGAGGLAPAVGPDAHLLAEEGEEDAGLLVAVAGQRLEAAEEFAAVRG